MSDQEKQQLATESEAGVAPERNADSAINMDELHELIADDRKRFDGIRAGA